MHSNKSSTQQAVIIKFRWQWEHGINQLALVSRTMAAYAANFATIELKLNKKNKIKHFNCFVVSTEKKNVVKLNTTTTSTKTHLVLCYCSRTNWYKS